MKRVAKGSEIKRAYEYEILVGKKVLWKGINPEKVFDKICKEHPKAKIGIRWKGREGVLIA